MNNSKETIGARIKEIREHNNLTQKEFGEKIKISHSHLSGIEADKKIPSDSIIKLICIVFGVSEKWLRYGEGSRNSTDNIHSDIENLLSNPVFPLIQIIKSIDDTDNENSDSISRILDRTSDIIKNNIIPIDCYSKYLDIVSDILSSLSALTISITKDYFFDAKSYTISKNVLEEDISKLCKLFMEIERKRIR